MKPTQGTEATKSRAMKPRSVRSTPITLVRRSSVMTKPPVPGIEKNPDLHLFTQQDGYSP